MRLLKESGGKPRTVLSISQLQDKIELDILSLKVVTSPVYLLPLVF